MTDIVARLRACDCGIHCKSSCIQEMAADEIERLRAALADEREACARIADGYRCGACGMDGKAAAEIRARTGLNIQQPTGMRDD